jgi:hypothetical protein
MEKGNHTLFHQGNAAGFTYSYSMGAKGPQVS